MIMDKCSDLLPDYFSFVKGLVDSADLSLNISREILQHDRQLKIIASSIEKKIKRELLNMLKNDRESYEIFYNAFSRQLKYGVYADFGKNKEILSDLLMFVSSNDEKLTTLDEYIERMKEDQKFIYYACGESVSKIAKLPQTEKLKDKGFEILYLTEDIDEFALKMLMNYKEKEFKSVAAADLGIEETNEVTDANKDLFEKMKNLMADKLKDIRPSITLKSHPVCITAEGEISIEMEKVLNQMPGNEQKISAQKVLEINVDHPVFEKLKTADDETLKNYLDVLYSSALLIEGLSIEDPVEFSNKICKLI